MSDQSPAPRERDAALRRVDLVALADALLGRAYNGMWPCPNPDHSQTGLSPPLNVFVGPDGMQRWHCFGCGDGGTAIDLLERAGEVAGYRDALAWLATADERMPARRRGPTRRRAAKPLPPGYELEGRGALGEYAEMARHALRGARDARRWLRQDRAIPEEVIEAAHLGYDPGPNRLPRPRGTPIVYPSIVFPVRDNGRVIYTQSRHLRPRPRSPRWRGTDADLAPNPGVAFLDPPTRTRSGLVVTEGPMDGLSALAAGYRAAALLGGGGANLRVARRLAEAGERLLLAFDNDNAGALLAHRLETLLRDNTAARWDRLHIPSQYKDLNEWHVAYTDAAGAEGWRAVVGAAARLGRSARRTPALPPVVSL